MARAPKETPPQEPATVQGWDDLGGDWDVLDDNWNDWEPADWDVLDADWNPLEWEPIEWEPIEWKPIEW